MLRFPFTKRYREIIYTLIRHGFGWLVVKLGLSALVPFHWGLMGHPRRKERYSAPEHLRMAFEELGPTFIKLAQILSTRPDLISPLYAEEFSKLQDRVPPRPFEEIKDVLEAELGQPYQNVFLGFRREAIASASLGQVYSAMLPGEKSVVVKIQKPGVHELVSTDLEILRDFAMRISRQTELGRKYDLLGLLDEFAFSLINELNYVREGQNADRFRVLFKDDPRVFIPSIHWDLTTSRVLVMDEVRGIKVNELTQDHIPVEVDRRSLAVTAVEATLKEIFEHGFFHADPHPGNFVIMDGSVLGLMDFGMVGYLDERYRESFLRLTYDMVRGNTEDMLDALWDLGISGRYVNRAALKRDLNHLLFSFRESSLEEILAGDLLRELMAIAYRHDLHFPPDLALLFKVLAMCEGLGALIDPHFKLYEIAQPYFKNLYLDLFSARNIGKKAASDVIDLLLLGRGLPQRLSRLLQRVESGDIQITIGHTGLERNSAKIYRSINRLTVSLLLTLFLIGAGVYMLAGHFLGFGFYMVNILLGMVICTAAICVLVLVSMWRQRKY